MTSAVASATMTATTAVASAPAATTMGCAMAPAIRSAMPAVGAAAVTVASAICATVAVVTTVAATKTIPISPMAIARPWVITTTRVAVTSAAIITASVVAAPVIAASVISVAVISVAVIVVVPGSDPDEHASYEVARPVVPVRCTIVGIIRVIAIGAAWGRSIVVVPRSNLNADRNLRGRCCCQQERRGDKYDVL
jgi:hypothetical protein